MSTISFLEKLSLGGFVVCWFGYAYVTELKERTSPSLLSAVRIYRREWMLRVIEREQRIMDCYLISTLSNTNTFFASTTLLILGGLIALLGSTDKVINVLATLPFIMPSSSQESWVLKIMLLIIIFIYAFFKFTLSLRHFTYVSILLGAAPIKGKDSSNSCAAFVKRTTGIVSTAGDNFNLGLRSYYFGLAALASFIHPGLFILSTAWVMLILYRREFYSPTLKMLLEE